VELGFTIRNAHRMTQGFRKTQIPLVLVDVERTSDARDIFQLPKLFGLTIQVESLRRRTTDGQCHRCQGFGHAASCCHAKPMCVRCAGDHLTADCKKPNTTDPATCANCGGPHPANYRGCPRHPKHARYGYTEADKQQAERTMDRYSFRPAWMNATERPRPEQVQDMIAALKSTIESASLMITKLTDTK
jgi:hypothetical protein